METTKEKSIPEALRMLAGWIEEGRKIEYLSHVEYGGWVLMRESFDIRPKDYIYRAKPRKPRVGWNNVLFAENKPASENKSILTRESKASVVNCDGLIESVDGYIRLIELTPEVIEACKAAGIEVE